jgi:DNA-binding NarL/FixJ family response regulator
MRIAVVGRPVERARLRARLDASLEVVAEFDSLDVARHANPLVDAILLAPVASRSFDAEDGEWIDEPLTVRERDVLELLAEGLPNKAIAARLGISDQTVKFHIASLLSKLGASNRTEAVRRALRRGLVNL